MESYDESSDSASNKGRTQRLADALLADRNKVKSKHNIIPCFSCGQTFVYRGRQGELNGRFCTLRCQQWFDDGNPTYEEQREHEQQLINTPLGDLVVVAGAKVGSSYYADVFGDRLTSMKRSGDGFTIKCAGCSKEFVSRGLRCCSTDCERRYCERQRNLETMAEFGIEPAAKRVCAGPGCSAVIPKWRKGRRVSSATRFCSPKCAQRARAAVS